MLRLEVGLLAVSTVTALAVYMMKVLPLSANPASPPPGIALAWAGQQLRGYSETNYITVESCEEPVKVRLDLYRTGVAPEPEFTQSLKPGRVALAIVGNPEMDPEDVRISAPLPSRKGGLKLLPFHAEIQSNLATGEQEAVVFTFDWNPSFQFLRVFFESDWLSPRTADRSCWLTAPAQLDGALAGIGIANSAIGHAAWSRSYLGQPLFSAATVVNRYGGALILNSSASTPSPSSLEPPMWFCGGSDFQSSFCQAAVALESPNSESSRSRDLVFWSTLGGLLLSVCGGAFIAAMRQLTKRP
jgi:hypothetical protein